MLIKKDIINFVLPLLSCKTSPNIKFCYLPMVKKNYNIININYEKVDETRRGGYNKHDQACCNINAFLRHCLQFYYKFVRI